MSQSEVIKNFICNRKTRISACSAGQKSLEGNVSDRIYTYHVAKFQDQATSGRCSKSREKHFVEFQSRFSHIKTHSRGMPFPKLEPPWKVITFEGQIFVNTMCSSEVMAKNVFFQSLSPYHKFVRVIWSWEIQNAAIFFKFCLSNNLI